MGVRKDSATSSIIFWGALIAVLVGFGLWCVYDGWFYSAYQGTKDAGYNRLFAVGAFAAALWCFWSGQKEYRRVKQQASEGSPGASGTASGPGSRPADGDEKNKPA